MTRDATGRLLLLLETHKQAFTDAEIDLQISRCLREEGHPEAA